MKMFSVFVVYGACCQLDTYHLKLHVFPTLDAANQFAFEEAQRWATRLNGTRPTVHATGSYGEHNIGQGSKEGYTVTVNQSGECEQLSVTLNGSAVISEHGEHKMDWFVED